MYGLYSARLCGSRGEKILVLEYDSAPFMRATYINQARIHMGYHYPRSYSTAIRSAEYFRRFVEEFKYCIHSDFKQIYATSSAFSWTNAEQFSRFCAKADIACERLSPITYFKEGMCDGVFLTEEYSFDAKILRDRLLKEIADFSNTEIMCNARIKSIKMLDNIFEIEMKNGQTHSTGFILNATYASLNQILRMLNYPLFKIKYELCEIILCKVNKPFQHMGITVMDGPFFSIMPFGKTGFHSLTSVSFTPHITSYEVVPTFECQRQSINYCTPLQLGNCNQCSSRPQSSWKYMSSLAKKYIKDEYRFEYEGSLYSIKPILMASEIDDSRPTLVKQYSTDPTFISVLSGKINTIYDLDGVLTNDIK